MSVLGEINKCITSGVTFYTDKRCPENTLQSFEINQINVTPTEPTEYNSPNVNGIGYKSGRWYNDHTGYKEAFKISVSKRTPILIYGKTDWCPYCKKLESTFLSNSDVNKVLSRFVKVKLNPDHSSKDEELFKSWGGTGYPTLFVQSSEDSIPRKIKRPFIKQDDKWKIISKEAFISILREQLDS